MRNLLRCLFVSSLMLFLCLICSSHKSLKLNTFYKVVKTWPHPKRLYRCIFQKIFNAKLTGKFVPVFAIKAHEGNRGVTPLILDVLARRMYVIDFKDWPLYPQVIRQAPTEQKTGRVPATEQGLTFWARKLFQSMRVYLRTRRCRYPAFYGVE